MNNEQRAEQLWAQYGADFGLISKQQIIDLLSAELADPQPGTGDYIRLLCGYLFCIGDASDAILLEKAKYDLNMDIGCMIDAEWIESLKQDDTQNSSRQALINSFAEYYQHYFTAPNPQPKKSWLSFFFRTR